MASFPFPFCRRLLKFHRFRGRQKAASFRAFEGLLGVRRGFQRPCGARFATLACNNTPVYARKQAVNGEIVLQQSCFSQGHFEAPNAFKSSAFEASKLVSTKTLLLKHYCRHQGKMGMGKQRFGCFCLAQPDSNFRNDKSAQKRKFGDGYPADIRGSFARISRPKTSVRSSKYWKNKHLGADIDDPKARTSTTLRDFQNIRSKNFGLNFCSPELFKRRKGKSTNID